MWKWCESKMLWLVAFCSIWIRRSISQRANGQKAFNNSTGIVQNYNSWWFCFALHFQWWIFYKLYMLFVKQTVRRTSYDVECALFLLQEEKRIVSLICEMNKTCETDINCVLYWCVTDLITIFVFFFFSDKKIAKHFLSFYISHLQNQRKKSHVHSRIFHPKKWFSWNSLFFSHCFNKSSF